MARIDARLLSDFAHETRLRSAPPEVQSMARTLLVDTLGCLVGGLQYPDVIALGERLGAFHADGQGELPFGRLVTWGAAATWLDADSGGSFHPQGHRMPPVPTAHPAPHVLPVLLHYALEDDRTDEELLDVFLAATEIGMRFGVGTTLRPGFHPHGIHGPVAAAVAAALLQGLDREATANAILIGLSQPLTATLTVPMRGGTVRNIWTGLGAYLGAQAATRAADGLKGDIAVVEELFDTVVCTNLDADEIHGDLGTRWRILDSYIKPYACARWIHPALDAFTAAIESSGRQLGPSLDTAIDSIEVRTFAFAAALDAREVETDLHARFSLPTCLAALAVHGELVAATFLPENLSHPRVARLAGLINVRKEPQFTAALPAERPTAVSVSWADGQTSTESVRNAGGNPGTPLSADHVEHKFANNVRDILKGDTTVVALLNVGDVGTNTPHHLRGVAQRMSEKGLLQSRRVQSVGRFTWATFLRPMNGCL